MTYQAAMAFLEALSGQPDIRPAPAATENYQELARHATRLGFPCTAQELDQAFRHSYNILHAAWRKKHL
ncbi:MAG TPA: hypothetical protein VGV37_21760 [Aliidongia sp.]|uniref:hypothetical protein n=1 Tax=Aliidongia sp. TaxID=1914230 RepID=UPI002DDCCB28|nr:hypothetical protein [Aliidongia sp.]HEV2677169.1 hypothetical protein [Aliidongia sp.]